MKAGYAKGLRDGLPIALGYVSVAFAFGIQATAAGLSPLQAVLISLLNVTSAGQLAGLQLMVGGASMAEMALTQLTINLRYALMSLSLSQKLDRTMTLPHRLLISFCNTDEVFVVASRQEGRLGRVYLYGLTNGPFAGWVLGTLLGALAGGILPGGADKRFGHRDLRHVYRYRAAAVSPLPRGARRCADRRGDELRFGVAALVFLYFQRVSHHYLRGDGLGAGRVADAPACAGRTG